MANKTSASQSNFLPLWPNKYSEPRSLTEQQFHCLITQTEVRNNFCHPEINSAAFVVITDFSICLTTKIAILSLLQTNDKIKHSRETAQLVTSASEHGRMENANPKEDAVWNSDRICRLQVRQAPRQSQEGKRDTAWQRVRCGTASVCLWFREAGLPSGGHAVPGMRTSGVRLHALLPLDWRPWDVGL